MKKALITLTALLGLAVNSQAKLDTFNFSDIGADFSFTGIVSGTPNGDGSYTITSGSATFSASSDLFAGLTATIVPNPNAPSTTTEYGNVETTWDNIAYPNQTPSVDRVGGLLFTLNSNGTQYYINPYDISGQDITWIEANGSAINYPNQEKVTQDYGQNVIDVKKVSITSFVPAAPGAPAPPLTACLAFAAVLLLQGLRKRREA